MQKISFNEDRSAVWLAFLFIALALCLPLGVGNLLGWVIGVKVWTDPLNALAPLGKSFSHIPGWISLIATLAFIALLLLWERRRFAENKKAFLSALLIVLTLTMIGWVLGHAGIVAAVPNEREKLGLKWSMGLTGEAGYLAALFIGLIIGNFPGFKSTKIYTKILIMMVKDRLL